jgi:hypothetical protein
MYPQRGLTSGPELDGCKPLPAAMHAASLLRVAEMPMCSGAG